MWICRKTVGSLNLGCSFLIFFLFFFPEMNRITYTARGKKKRIKVFLCLGYFPGALALCEWKGRLLGDGPGAGQEKTRPSHDPRAQSGHSATFGLQVAAAAGPSCWPPAPKMLGTQFGLASWMEVTPFPSVQVSYRGPRRRAAGRGRRRGRYAAGSHPAWLCYHQQNSHEKR